MTKRTDTHSPSNIIPEDYIEVGYLPKVEFGMVEFILAERKRIEAHMKKTGGRWDHPSSGSCAICGNVMAMSHVIFYHAKTNTYIKVGETCAMKVDFSISSGFNEFKTKLKNYRKLQAGKRKAQGELGERSLEAAWVIYETEWDDLPRNDRGQVFFEEEVIRDMTSKLINYGSLSDKQWAFMEKLVNRIPQRAQIEAERAAKHEAAKPAPVTDERITIEGRIVSLKYDRFEVYRMLVETDEGWKAWGSVPSALIPRDEWDESGLKRGDRVRFCAAFNVSDNDPKFGFFRRPTKAELLEEAA